MRSEVNRSIGAIFCRVERTQHMGHDREFITGGSQKWHGVIPSFISILVIIMIAGFWAVRKLSKRIIDARD